MKIILPCTALLMIASCVGGPRIGLGDIPTIKIDPIGEYQVPEKGSPAERYIRSYDKLVRAHRALKANLNTNILAVRKSLESTIRNLTIMKEMTIDPFAADLQTYIEKYNLLYKNFSSRNFTQATIRTLDRYEKEIRIKFNPKKVSVLVEMPAKYRPKPRPIRGGRRPVAQNPAQTDPRGTTPAAPGYSTSPLPGENVNPHPGKPGPNVIPVPGDTPFWVVFKAWQQSHDELVIAYRQGQGDFNLLFSHLKDTITLMKSRLKQTDQARLQIYINEYDRVFRTTLAFSTLPEGYSKADIINELNTVSAVIHQTYHSTSK